MDSLTVILTFVGAFAGAVFAPFGEYVFERLLGRRTDKMVSGFVLLCVANAFWVIIAFLFNLGGIVANLWLISALYFISVMIFIAAFRAFSLSDLKRTSLSLFKSMRWLLLGNMVWVLADFAGHLQSYFFFSELLDRTVTPTILLVSMIFFLAGALTLRRDVKGNGGD